MGGGTYPHRLHSAPRSTHASAKHATDPPPRQYSSKISLLSLPPLTHPFVQITGEWEGN